MALLRLACHLYEKGKPAAHKTADRSTKFLIGPASRDHFLQHAYVARVQVLFEEVAGSLISLPKRRVLGVHVLLTRQSALILQLEHLQNEALLGAEVVVQLTQWYSGLISHLSGREAAIAIR